MLINQNGILRHLSPTLKKLHDTIKPHWLQFPIDIQPVPFSFRNHDPLFMIQKYKGLAHATTLESILYRPWFLSIPQTRVLSTGQATIAIGVRSLVVENTNREHKAAS